MSDVKNRDKSTDIENPDSQMEKILTGMGYLIIDDAGNFSNFISHVTQSRRALCGQRGAAFREIVNERTI